MPRRQPVAPGRPPPVAAAAAWPLGPAAHPSIPASAGSGPGRDTRRSLAGKRMPPDPMDPEADVVARSGGAYLTSSVPFISVWTSHRKPYVPGASAGTLYVTSFGPPNGSSPKTFEENELS
jgi:hypothetical protein